MKPRYFICGPRYIGGWETSKVIYLKVDSNGTKAYFSNKTPPTNQSFWSIGECERAVKTKFFQEVTLEELALII